MFIVEDSTGLPNANSLASVQDFKDYYSLSPTYIINISSI